MSLTRATEQDCNIFICYRQAIGCNLTKELYDWMEESPLWFGSVYFSDIRPDANWYNDIKTYLRIAKTVIIFIDENFTDKFPKTKEGFESQRSNPNEDKIITAFEVEEIINRVRNKTEQNPVPQIIIFKDNNAQPDYNPIKLIAGDFDKSKENDESVNFLTNIFATAGHNIDLRGVAIEVRKTTYENILNSLGSEANPNEKMSCVNNMMNRLPAVMTENLIDQFIELDKAGTDNSIDLQELVNALINGKHPKGGADENKNYRTAIITGNSGMGKTTQLIKLCRSMNDGISSTNINNGEKVPVIYVPAHNADYTVLSDNLLYDIIARICAVDMNKYTDSMSYIRKHLLTKSTAAPDRAPCVFLIDALDEVQDTAKKDSIMRAVFNLVQEGAAVVITSRGDISSYMVSFSDTTVNRDFISAKMMTLKDAINNIPEKYKPLKNSPLAKLLEVPLYFSMYRSATEDFSAENNLLKVGYYSYPLPMTSGELIWNNMMRHLIKRRTGNSDRSVSELNSWFFIMYILPYLAVNVSVQSVSGIGLETVYDEACSNFTEWHPFWDINSCFRLYIKRNSWTDGQLPNFKSFIDWLENQFPLLQGNIIDDTQMWRFSHAIMREFFTALYFTNAICDIAKGTNADSKWVTQLKETHLKPSTAKLIGEICGERFNLPTLNENEQKWESNSNDTAHKTIHNALNNIRGSENSAVLVNNLYTVLKQSRRLGDTIPDLSNVNLSELDLTRCSLTNVLFSHVNPFDKTKSLCAKFTKSKLNITSSFSGGHQNLSPSLCIETMCAWSANRLITVDKLGCIILWDTDLDLPLCIRQLNAGKSTLSNIIKVDNELLFAFGNRLCKLTMSDNKTQFEAEIVKELPTRAVNQIGYDTVNNKLFYHPSDCPLDRYDVDGNLYSGEIKDGRWLPNTVVCGNGDVAFTVSYVQNCNCFDDCANDSGCHLDGEERTEEPQYCPGRERCSKTWKCDDFSIPNCIPYGRFLQNKNNAKKRRTNGTNSEIRLRFRDMNLVSAVELGKWTKGEDGWTYQTVITPKNLFEITDCDVFSHAHLKLERDEKGNERLLLILNCSKVPNGSKRIVLRLSVGKDGNSKLQAAYNMPSGRPIHSACIIGIDVFCASYLSIFRCNQLGEAHQFCEGEGRLQFAKFLPDTKSIFTVTDGPVRAQIFTCDTLPEWKCVCQIVPTVSDTNLLKFSTACPAFRFSGDLKFTESKYMEHPERLWYVLSGIKSNIYSVDISTGYTETNIPDDVYLIKAPQWSFFNSRQEQFKVQPSGQLVRLVRYLSGKEPLPSIKVHSEWLFAGCEFAKVTWETTDPLGDLEHYITQTVIADNNDNDIHTNQDSFTDDEIFYNDSRGYL